MTTDTTIQPAAFETLQASLRGQLIDPNGAEYETARRVWNGMIDRRPALIARCTGAADVIASAAFAREHGLEIAVRGGGHNVAGNAVCDDGLVIDLSGMRSVRVDPDRRTAYAGPGCTWADFDHETQAFGLATTGGLVSTTGIAGFTLGGGIGWLVRKHGLACDNLRSVDLVTAEGRLLHASAAENEELFWGVRGGGGNFGVVTSFEYQLHPVGAVVGGLVLHPLARAGELLHFYRDFVTGAPDELTTLVVILTAPPMPFIPQALHGTVMIAIVVCYAGEAAKGEEAVRPLRQFGPPAVDLIGPMPYVALQQMFDAGAPAGLQNYWKSAYLRGLDDAVIDTLCSYAERLPGPLCAVHLHHLGGAVARVPERATAFAYRDAAFVLNIPSLWADPADSDAVIAWTRSFFDAVQPYTEGAYVNFLGAEGEERVRAAYGGNYERLAALKARYDPNNVFHFNQNIRPSATL